MPGSAPLSIPPSANTSPNLAAAIAPGLAGPAADSSSGHRLAALPQPLARAVQLRLHADILLQSLQRAHRRAGGGGGHGHDADGDGDGDGDDDNDDAAAAGRRRPHVEASQLLDEAIQSAQLCLDPATANHSRLSDEHRARAAFCLGWATARRAQLVADADAASNDLLHRVQLALEYLELATRLVPAWFPPTLPLLAATPSVTRPTDPNRHHASVDGWPLVPAWAAELVAELARTQTILAVAKAMSIQQHRAQPHRQQQPDADADADADADERHLAELIDLACRRNVQALFTPVDPHSHAEANPVPAGAAGAGAGTGSVDLDHAGGNTSLADASTVLGNARLLRDVLSALVPYTTSPREWKLRLEWATHIADVQFVSASLSANRLVDVASAEAAKLQRSHITPHERRRVKRVLERTARRMAPFEVRQGNILLWLGRVMLDAVGALYLGRTTEGFQAERRRREQSAARRQGGREGQDMAQDDDDDEEEEEEEEEQVPVPENDLVRETRQVLIRAAALFENAYASIVRAPASARRRRLELRVLRRLEATYCDLEHLDNTSSPEVIELRSQRIERAVLINERLISLGDGASSGTRSTRNGRGRGATGLDEDEMDESDREQAAEEDEDDLGSEDDDDDDDEDDSEDEHDRLTKALGRARLS